MLLDVSLITPQQILFEGKASSVIVPGEIGCFEILPFHKRLLSRLVSGVIFVDDKSFYIRRGVVKVDQNRATIIIEEKI